MGYNPAAAVAGRSPVRFRLIPREEKFYADFIALADELVVGATLLEEMLAPDTARLGEGQRHQGHRATLRLPHARDHPAPEPHVRHAARPRGHPRARPLARRRDGRHRRVGRRHPPLPDRPTSGSARASSPASSSRADRAGPRRRWRRSRRASGVACRDASRSTGSRTRPTALHDEALRRLFDGGARPDHSS